MKKTILIGTFIFISAACFSQQKSDSVKYFVVGILHDFNTAITALLNPDEVSVNKRKQLAEWLSLNAKALPPAPAVPVSDSTKQKTKKSN